MIAFSYDNKFARIKNQWIIKTTPAIVKCTKVIGLALNARRKLPSCLFNRTETDRFFAVIATGKECKIVPDDSKRRILSYHNISLGENRAQPRGFCVPLTANNKNAIIY